MGAVCCRAVHAGPDAGGETSKPSPAQVLGVDEGAAEAHSKAETKAQQGSDDAKGTEKAYDPDGYEPIPYVIDISKPYKPFSIARLGAPDRDRGPCNEGDRAHTAREINRTRAPHDPRLDHILNVLCTVFETDTAVVAFLSPDCIHICNATGVLAKGRCPWRWGFCGNTLTPENHEVLAVEDLHADARFSSNPVVKGPPHLSFYVAAPLVSSNNHRLGTLCILSTQPRKFDANGANLLANLAELTVRTMEERWALEEQKRQAAVLMRRAECYQTPILFVDVSKPRWRVLHINEPAMTRLGLHDTRSGDAQQAAPQAAEFWDLFCLRDTPAGPSAEAAELAASGEGFTLSGLRRRDPLTCVGRRLLNFTFRAANRDGVDADQVPVGVPSFLPMAGKRHAQYYFVEAAFALALERGGSASVGSEASLGRASSADPQAASAFAAACAQVGRAQPTNSSGPTTPDAVTWQVVRDALPSSGASLSGSLPGSGHVTSRSGSGLGRGPSGQVDSASGLCSSAGGGARRAVAASPLLPQAMSGLELGPLLGQGSFGRVYRGVWQGHLVAVKIISDVKDVRMCEGQVLEAAITQGLDHASIVRTYASAVVPVAEPGPGGTGREAWMLLEFCDMGCLVDAVVKGWLRRKRDEAALPNVPAILAIAHQIADAMALLHARDIVHGDLTGGNVMLASDNSLHGFCAKIADFGLARTLDPAAAHAKIHTVHYGTITHMPPEVLQSEAMTKAADVYSFGVLLWEMLTGTRAYAGMTHAQVVLAVVAHRQALGFPAALAVPPPLPALAVSCMAPSPAARPSFVEILAALARMQPKVDAWVVSELPALETAAEAAATAAVAAAPASTFVPENVRATAC